MMLIVLFVGFVLFFLFLFHGTDDGIQGLTLARQALTSNIELYPGLLHFFRFEWIYDKWQSDSQGLLRGH